MIPWFSILFTFRPCTPALFPRVDCTAASSQPGALEAWWVLGGGGAKPGRPTPLQVLQGLWPPHQDTPELGLTLALPWQVLALARQQNKRVKVVGGGHSPSDIACTDGFMIHMGKMNRVLQVLRASAPPTSAILRPSNLSLYPRPQGP